jgi:hypothetical protein
MNKLEPGAIINLGEGSYRVASKTANADGVTYKFATMQGKYVSAEDSLRITAACKTAEGINRALEPESPSEESVEHHGESTTEELTHADEGFYIRMVYLQDGDLELQATEHLREQFATNETWMPTIYELLDDFTTNGWEWVNPEDVTNDLLADPDGHIYERAGDPIDELRTQGKFIMTAEGKLNDSSDEQALTPEEEDSVLDGILDRGM